jgi:ATP-dependent DNA ligase
VKLDGYRGVAVFDAAGKPQLWSRNGLPLEKKFPAVAKALSNLKLRSTTANFIISATLEAASAKKESMKHFTE